MTDEPRNISVDDDYQREMAQHLARLMDGADASKDHGRSIFADAERAKLAALRDEEGEKA